MLPIRFPLSGSNGLFAVLWIALQLVISPCSTSTLAADQLVQVRFRDDGESTRTVGGRIVVEAVDGGLLLEGRDGRLWSITPEQLLEKSATDEKFSPLSADELGEQLLAELGAGFEIVTTRRYVIATSAGTTYGKWCGALFERLATSFHTHWRTARLDLHEPEFPLTAVVFADQQQYAKFATADAGPGVAESPGYYSARTNRIVLYDLTAKPGTPPARSFTDITRKVAAAPFNAATVVHEATHQLAFNVGLHTRYADNPLWLTEGLAMYFETPDLRSRSGWRTVGRVNPQRLQQFADYAANRRPADSLITLLADNSRFAAADTAADAYAEAWALSYFLIKTRRDDYAEYLKAIAAKKPLIFADKAAHLKDFTAAFGEDLVELDRDFLRYVKRLRR